MRLPLVPKIDPEYTRGLVNIGAEIVGSRNNEETGLSETESKSIQRCIIDICFCHVMTN